MCRRVRGIKKRLVYLQFKNVFAGRHCATGVVIRDSKTKRKLHEARGCTDKAALGLAEAWIRERGYIADDFIENVL